jgi:hypothetical protein
MFDNPRPALLKELIVPVVEVPAVLDVWLELEVPTA